MADGASADGAQPSLTSRLDERRFSATRAFGDVLSPEDAAVMAEAAARATALRAATHILATLPEVRLAGRAAPSATMSLDLTALARATVETSAILVSRSRKAATVTVTVAITAAADAPPLEARARDALIHPDRLALYEKTVQRENALLAAFDALAPIAISERQHLSATDRERVRSIVAETRALDIFARNLPDYAGVWENPAKLRQAMLAATALAPQSALACNALGDAALQLGRGLEALEAQNRAVRADPQFARAYHSRGTAHLALGHPASAAADFTEAIRLAPGTAAYHRDRGIAQHLLGESTAMCRDLHEACALGDCEKLAWAIKNTYCASMEAAQ